MKNYMKNNKFVFCVLIFVWILFLGLSIGERGFFSKYFIETVGTTISLVIISSYCKAQMAKVAGKKENNKVENLEKNEAEDDSNSIVKTKKSRYNWRLLYKIYGSLLGVAIVLTVLVFYFREIEINIGNILTYVIGFIILELVVCTSYFFVVEITQNYIKKCKEKGFIKATLWLIIVLAAIGLIVYGKDAHLFRR